MSKPRFNINDYPGDYVMHCDTEDKARVFCDYLDSVSLQRCTNHSYKNKTYFGENLDKTAYYFNYGRFGAVHFVDDGYKILEFDDFDWSGWEEEKKMNYVKQFAEMLGVEIGEEFNLIDRYGNLFKDSPYKLTKNGFVDREGYSTFTLSGHVISGNCTIQKLPWKPKTGDEMWFVNPLGACYSIIFSRYNDFSILLYSVENCFESEEEAEKNRDKVMAMYDKLREELA